MSAPDGFISWSEYWESVGRMVLGHIAVYWRPVVLVLGVIALFVGTFMLGRATG